MVVIHRSLDNTLTEIFEGGTVLEVFEAIVEWFRSFNAKEAPIIQLIRWDCLSEDPSDKPELATVFYDMNGGETSEEIHPRQSSRN